jgi:hypothetical protein
MECRMLIFDPNSASRIFVIVAQRDAKRFIVRVLWK